VKGCEHGKARRQGCSGDGRTREDLRERLAQLKARGATGIIFGTSGYDVERELRAYAEIAGLR
jgi:hypothetical protein